MFRLIGKSLGHYRIEEAIGQGGMASVYRATDVSNGKTVAVKVMLQVLSLNDQFRQRFRREAEVLQRLQHANIVPVLDYGEFEDIPYIVMPFMSVGTLTDRLTSGPLKPLEGAQIFSQIASALHFAHENGVIHRDVKPSNILLDGDGNALLSDFGFAHIHDASLNLTGSALIGTPAYMSPEQIKGEPITAKADQYALGVILYELSTGALPYEGDTPMAVAIKHATDPLPAPSSKNANLPIEVEKIILRALDKDPADRFASIASFNHAFQKAMEASIDFISGRIKPEAFIPERTTLVLESSEMRLNLNGEQRRSRKLLPLLAMLLFLLGCPTTYWGYTLFNAPAAAAGEDRLIKISFAAEEATQVMDASNEGLGPQGGATLTPEPTSLSSTPGENTPTADITATGSGYISPSPTTSGSTTTPTPTLSASSTPLSSPTTVVTTASSTAVPSNTATINVPSTSTPTSTPKETATKTSTPNIVPTVILIPSSTPITVSTIAPLDCNKVVLANFNYNSNRITLEVSNLTGKSIKLVEFWLDWPPANDEFKKLILDGETIWEGEVENSPVKISGGWKGSGGDRTLSPGEVSILRVEFDRLAQPNGYQLELSFDNSCVASFKN
jgi:serine/threonine protein kinase